MRLLPHVLCALVLAPVLAGCVRRELTVTSEPSGALVFLNDEEVGRTPFTTEFQWYGTYDVVVRHPDRPTMSTERKLAAPWWQWVPIDFFAELAPWRPVDRQRMHLFLPPAQATQEQPEALIARGVELRDRLNAENP